MQTTTTYLLRDIPADLWKAVKIKALQQDRPIRSVLMDMLAAYATVEKGTKK